MLNSKYIKIKHNQKLEVKFFGPFRVLHPVGSQAYKLELPKQWRIHNVFYMSMLEQNTTKKGRVDEKTVEQLEFEAGSDNKKYELEGIYNSMVYARESEAGHLLGLYYLVFWKSYPKDKSTWEPASAVQHFRKLVSIFHKDHPNKLTTTSLLIDLALPIAKHTAPPNVNSKQKRGQSTGSVQKKAKH